MAPANKSTVSGIVIGTGPSRFDSAHIVAIAIGFGRPSANRKTGEVVQVYVLNSEVSPSQSISASSDRAVCGGCRHRPAAGNTCYVDALKGPDSVWKSFKAGRYGEIGDADYGSIAQKCVRLTAYGDVGALPKEAWEPFLARVEQQGCTVLGYTHHWRSIDPWFRKYCMASVETIREREEASALGWRTFRIRAPGNPLLPGEVQCPADSHADVARLCGIEPGTTNCDSCRRCTAIIGGVDVSIYPHGLLYRRTRLTDVLNQL